MKNGASPAHLLCHTANSGAILQLPEAHFDMVRAGIVLYGVYPSAEVRQTIPLTSGTKLEIPRGLLQGGETRPSGQLRFHLANRPHGACGDSAGRLR